MLKRPSSRRKSKVEQIQLNLVPILDTMVTLIGFLLMTMSFLVLVGIESPFPMADPNQQVHELKEKPLQLTVSMHEKEVEVWSPFDKFQSKKFPNVPSQTSPNADELQPDLKSIHDFLITIKQKFPMESKIVLVPLGDVNYDTLIAMMDSFRMLDPTDPAIFVKNAQTGTDEALKTLFPEVVFGNLLGG